MLTFPSLCLAAWQGQPGQNSLLPSVRGNWSRPGSRRASTWDLSDLLTERDWQRWVRLSCNRQRETGSGVSDCNRPFMTSTAPADWTQSETGKGGAAEELALCDGATALGKDEAAGRLRLRTSANWKRLSIYDAFHCPCSISH